MCVDVSRFKYVIVLDVDELIVPTAQSTLIDLVSHLDALAPSLSPFAVRPTGFQFRNAYYFLNADPDLGETLTYLRYHAGSLSEVGYSVKSITNPQTCLAMHNHYCWYRTAAHSDLATYDMRVCHFQFIKQVYSSAYLFF